MEGDAFKTKDVLGAGLALRTSERNLFNLGMPKK